MSALASGRLGGVAFRFLVAVVAVLAGTGARGAETFEAVCERLRTGDNLYFSDRLALDGEYVDFLRSLAGTLQQSLELLAARESVRRTGRTYAGVGTDMQDAIAAAGLAAAVSTDVGVTTWGKVKELFR